MENKTLLRTEEFLKKFIHYINLDTELDDYDKIHEQIVKDSVFKGTNLWILMFAIIVASVGLNMNSTAVIIGAMLISPLMGPINGMGYSIATYNFELFKQAFKNFSFAVIASLFASSLYFFLSPVATAHSELLARTSPTIYDVIIALFGGLAGIVAISSKQKGNVIPGVAIATALMPPLCTAGYGLATFQYEFFLGALFLFTINTVFIALSSVIISQLLKFPITTLIDQNQKKVVNRWISIIIVAITLPSIYFGYMLVLKEKFNENASKYVASVSIFEGNLLIKSDVDSKEGSITLLYGGTNISEQQKEILVEQAKFFELKDAKIIIKQGLDFGEFAKDKNAEVYSLKEELGKIKMVLSEKERQLDSIKTNSLLGKSILNEINNLYPDISKCTFADAYRFIDTSDTPENVKIVMFAVETNRRRNLDTNKINNWLRTRLNFPSIKVIYNTYDKSFD
ncbi:MAG: DUF389 domain-containing protein [Candidatus Kapabacteria bacterium]|nr:DUF389 domain-containing protein [Ignavibacteriota bacterium]MCW5885296.1 DUF389 domain-containing protein [Candidatus Kapabacteria bacterium]